MRILFAFLLLFSFACCSERAGIPTTQSLPPGKYIFSAPAIYSSPHGSAAEWLCELRTLHDDKQRLEFLVLGGGSYVDMVVSDSGAIKFDDAMISIGEVGRRMKGSGHMIGNKQAKGKVTVVSGSSGFPLVLRKKSEWYLRPATKKEIQDKMLEGLRRVEDALYRRGLEPTLKNIEHELGAGEGFGYSFSDRQKILKMIEEGTLIFSDHQFHLKTEVAAEEVGPPPILFKAETEKIPITRSEDYKQDFLSDSAERLGREVQRKP